MANAFDRLAEVLRTLNKTLSSGLPPIFRRGGTEHPPITGDIIDSHLDRLLDRLLPSTGKGAIPPKIRPELQNKPSLIPEEEENALPELMRRHQEEIRDAQRRLRRAEQGSAEIPAEQLGHHSRARARLARDLEGLQGIPRRQARERTERANAKARTYELGAQAARILGFPGVEEILYKRSLVARAAVADPTTSARLAEEEVMAKVGHAKGIFTQAGKAIKSESFGDVGGHLMGSVAHAGMLAGGPAGVAVAGFAKLGEVLFKSVGHLQEWGESLHNTNMRFAEFSGAMSAVQARQEVRDIITSQQRGDRRAAGAEDLSKAKTRLERATAPWEDMWANVKAEFFSGTAAYFSEIIEGINKLVGLSDKGNPSNQVTPFEQQTSFADDPKWLGNRGRPGRFGDTRV